MKQAATMQALQLLRVGELSPAALPLPEPRDGEVLIETRATTICTSDLNDIAGNPFGIPLPRVLGHEGAGVVASVGTGVTEFRVGDPVAAHPVVPCGDCDSCTRGLGHLCDRMGHLGLDRDGTFAEYFRHSASRTRRIPEGVSFEVAALVEPVAVCLEAVRRARLAAGEAVLVVGDGPFGIIISRLALAGGQRVVLLGRHDFRLRQVPDAVAINEREVADVQQAVVTAAGGAGIGAAILAVGSAAGIALALQVLCSRGRLVVFSAVDGPVPLDLSRLHAKELEMVGACNDEGYLDEALTLLSDPRLGLDSLVTHRLPFAEWERAFALAARGKDEALKVALTFNGVSR